MRLGPGMMEPGWSDAVHRWKAEGRMEPDRSTADDEARGGGGRRCGMSNPGIDNCIGELIAIPTRGGWAWASVVAWAATDSTVARRTVPSLIIHSPSLTGTDSSPTGRHLAHRRADCPRSFCGEKRESVDNPRTVRRDARRLNPSEIWSLYLSGARRWSGGGRRGDEAAVPPELTRRCDEIDDTEAGELVGAEIPTSSAFAILQDDVPQRDGGRRAVVPS